MDSIQPAQLSFLTIYNPFLGPTEETSHEQIVYHFSSRTGRARTARQAAGTATTTEEEQNEELNERMRQVGLAQGMVSFAREFANGQSVDYVDTEKSRAFVHEIEPGWWILASCDLTRIEVPIPKDKRKSAEGKNLTKTEYFSREVSPQPLLLKHIFRAHGIFLLHQGTSLSDIYARKGREIFSLMLERFWNRFIRHWDVLMIGSPAVGVFNGLKLGVGGELGMGADEEEWGSMERDVLEDLVGRTDGLVDLVVSRFGEPPSKKVLLYEEEPRPWMGAGNYPKATDGVVFSGVGAVARVDILRISAWMEWLYRFGLGAYGVQDNPQSSRRRHRTKKPVVTTKAQPNSADTEVKTPTKDTVRRGIPPPILPPAKYSSTQAAGENENNAKAESQSYVDTESLMKYMTLGLYGSSWSLITGKSSPARTPSTSSRSKNTSKPNKDEAEDSEEGPLEQLEPQSLEEQARQRARRHPDVTRGCFIIGLKGDLNAPTGTEEPSTDADQPSTAELSANSENSSQRTSAASRIQLRTVHMTRNSSVDVPSYADTARLRVVVYVRQPFIYTFLFDAKSQPGLSFQSFYKHLHSQLISLQQPLLRATSPADVQRRLREATDSPATKAALTDKFSPIYDLVYDPANGTCRSSIPDIPDLGDSVAVAARSSAGSPVTPGEGGAAVATRPPWTRSDAIAVHSAILRIWQDTRQRPMELERTVRTNRGWWVVWMRLPASSAAQEDEAVESDAGAAYNSNPDTAGSSSGLADSNRALGTSRSREEGAAGGDGVSSKAATTSTSRTGDGGSSHLPQSTVAGDSISDAASQRPHQQQSPGMLREAFLIRKVPEKTRRTGKGILAGFGSIGSREEDNSVLDAAKLAEGIGVVPRKYIEGLLSLNR